MEKPIRGQRAKINGLYDDPISLNIIESDELKNVLEKNIKSSNIPRVLSDARLENFLSSRSKTLHDLCH